MTSTGTSRSGLIGAALAGAATGGRAFTGLAALAMTARQDASTPPDIVLTRPDVRGLVGVLAVGELVADKLPAAPSRLEPLGLSGRIVIGALCGAIVDDDDGAGTVGCALVGALAAVAAAWLGTRWRSGAFSAFGRDWVGAVIEDATVTGLAAAAVRERRSRW